MLPELKPQKLNTLPNWLVLRDVQKTMFKNLANNYKQGLRRPVIQAPTGAGKTYWVAVLFHKIIEKNPTARLLFVVPRVSLIEQTYNSVKKILGVEAGVIRGVDNRLDLSKQIQIATVQTLSKRIEKHPSTFGMLRFDCTVIDECHLMFKGVEKIKSNWTIGITGTPYTKGLGLSFDSLVKSIPAKQLVEEKIIAPIRVMSCERQIDTSKLKTVSTGEYDSLEEEIALSEIIGDVVVEYEDSPDMQGRPFLGFAKNIASCIALAEAFQERGHEVGYIHSRMSDEDRKAVLSLFEQGYLRGVFSVNTLCEGYDYPEASALILCTAFAPSKHDETTPNALNRYVQMLGRVRRMVEGKSYALIHDHCENYTKYGHPDSFELGFNELHTTLEKNNKDKDQSLESKIKPTICPECGSYVDRGNLCSFCGHTLKKYTEIIDGEIVYFDKGKMVEVEKASGDNKKKNPKVFTKEQKQCFYSGLIHEFRKINMNRTTPMSEGWIAHKYKAKFGVFPRGLSKTPEYSLEASNFVKYQNIKFAKSRATPNKHIDKLLDEVVV